MKRSGLMTIATAHTHQLNTLTLSGQDCVVPRREKDRFFSNSVILMDGVSFRKKESAGKFGAEIKLEPLSLGMQYFNSDIVMGLSQTENAIHGRCIDNKDEILIRAMITSALYCSENLPCYYLQGSIQQDGVFKGKWGRDSENLKE